MRTSNFQFSDPSLVEFIFKLNPEFEPDENGETAIKTEFDVRVHKEDNLKEAFVELEVKIGSEKSEVPFFIKAVEGAQFRWKMDDGRIDSFLNINAPSLLLSYLRPLIATITAASPYNAYNIPFMNFIDSDHDN